MEYGTGMLGLGGMLRRSKHTQKEQITLHWFVKNGDIKTKMNMLAVFINVFLHVGQARIIVWARLIWPRPCLIKRVVFSETRAEQPVTCQV